MSRAYRIRISESLERIIHIEDGVATTLEILPILPQERMRALLADELARGGFVVEEGTAKRRSTSAEGDVEIAVELATGQVSVRVARSQEVRLSVDEEARVAEEHKVVQEQRAREAAVARLERDADKVAEGLRRAATARLEGELRDARRELDGVIHRVTASALKERAAQLGEIEELTEDAEAGTLTIRVRV